MSQNSLITSWLNSVPSNKLSISTLVEPQTPAITPPSANPPSFKDPTQLFPEYLPLPSTDPDSVSKSMVVHNFLCRFGESVLNLPFAPVSYYFLHDILTRPVDHFKPLAIIYIYLLDYLDMIRDLPENTAEAVPMVPYFLSVAFENQFPNIVHLSWEQLTFNHHVTLLSYLVDMVCEDEHFRKYLNDIHDQVCLLRRDKWSRSIQRKELQGKISTLDADIERLDQELDVIEKPIVMEGASATQSEADTEGNKRSEAIQKAMETKSQREKLKSTAGKLDDDRRKKLNAYQKSSKSLELLDAKESEERQKLQHLNGIMRDTSQYFLGSDAFGNYYWWWQIYHGAEDYNLFGIVVEKVDENSKQWSYIQDRSTLFSMFKCLNDKDPVERELRKNLSDKLRPLGFVVRLSHSHLVIQPENHSAAERLDQAFVRFAKWCKGSDLQTSLPTAPIFDAEITHTFGSTLNTQEPYSVYLKHQIESKWQAFLQKSHLTNLDSIPSEGSLRQFFVSQVEKLNKKEINVEEPQSDSLSDLYHWLYSLCEEFEETPVKKRSSERKRAFISDDEEDTKNIKLEEESSIISDESRVLRSRHRSNDSSERKTKSMRTRQSSNVISSDDELQHIPRRNLRRR